MYLPKITPCFVELPQRGLITVSDQDAFKFLQNLVTNDLAKLDHAPLVHACLLTAQGKFLHDFYITRRGENYLLDCEGGERAEDLYRRLNLYKLRANITLHLETSKNVFVILDEDKLLNDRTFIKPDMPQKDFSFWDEIRIKQSIADGSRDAEIEKSTLSELNMEESAIDYNKGCYVGQELTARIHHRGLAKKHLYPVKFNLPAPPFGTPLTSSEKNIGEMRSSCGSIGLALLKDELLPLPQDGFYVLEIAN